MDTLEDTDNIETARINEQPGTGTMTAYDLRFIPSPNDDTLPAIAASIRGVYREVAEIRDMLSEHHGQTMNLGISNASRRRYGENTDNERISRGACLVWGMVLGVGFFCLALGGLIRLSSL